MNTSDNNLAYVAEIIKAKLELRSSIPDLAVRFRTITTSIESQVEALVREKRLNMSSIPTVDFHRLPFVEAETVRKIKERGAVIVRGVFEASRVKRWNDEITDYLCINEYEKKQIHKMAANEYFRKRPNARPQFVSIYWSKPQMEARQSRELAVTRRFLNSLWDTRQYDGHAFNPDRECTYADRIRLRKPGDGSAGLPPHVDGGSIERWIDPTYRKMYGDIFYGDVLQYDPFAGAHRADTKEILAPAVCSMFRTYQGWIALTEQGPGDGTLKVAPIANAMAWILLRSLQNDVQEPDLCGAIAGRGIVLSDAHHGLLLRGYNTIPRVDAGDTIWWHPDVVHGVEDVHGGNRDSSVMYIGSAPECEKNSAFLAKQRVAFEAGRSSPDFYPDDFEVDFVNRFVTSDLSDLGRMQMGYA